MNEVKVSVLMLNIDRYWMGRYVLEHNFANCGIPLSDIEFLVLDNGSTDKRAIEYLSSIADLFVQKTENVGVAKGFNELLREARGKHICLIGNDILLNKNWLKDMIYYNEKIDKSGITGIHCEGDKGVVVKIGGVNVYKRPSNTIDGITLFNRKMLDIVGGFDESFGMYGMEDNQFSARISMAGFHNYCIPFQYGIHLGRDINFDTDYRKQKNKAVELSAKRYIESISKMRKDGIYKIPIF